MACVNCQKIRDAVLHGRMAEAAGLTVEKLRESIGWKSPEADSLAIGGPVSKGEPAFVGETSGESIVLTKDTKAK